MKKTNKRSVHTEKLVLLALLSAMVAILAYYGGFIKIGGVASISLTLIPVVVGATLCGSWAGAWLGLVFSVMVFICLTSVKIFSGHFFTTPWEFLLRQDFSG